jgi:hypothetical protein
MRQKVFASAIDRAKGAGVVSMWGDQFLAMIQHPIQPPRIKGNVI